MRIDLDFIEEYEGVRFSFESATGEHAQIKIEIFHGLCILKESAAQGVFKKIDFDVVFKELASRFPDDIGLSDLPCAVDNENSSGIGFEIVRDVVFYLSKHLLHFSSF